MSFSSSTKDEIAKRRVKSKAERLAMLCALTHTAGSLTLGRGVGIQYITENHSVAKLIASLASGLYHVEASLAIREQDRLKSRSVLVRLTGADCEKLLRDAGCLPSGDAEQALGSIPEAYQNDDASVQSLLRGAFLGSGSVAAPQKGYHLEIVSKHEGFAQELCALFNRYELNAKCARRKSSYIVYIKEGDKVADFLRLLGASNSTMGFEHARVVRNVSNNLNRQRNFEDANMQKAAKAAAQQLIQIESIQKTCGLASLPKRLYAVAEARLNNPEATLTELAEMLEISKSCLNHRFMKLAAYAADHEDRE
ncbi:MAG: DNA-binding protein WhiA [Eubacteriales bacterium]|nr:DNA-binding protein WhiA [Eubacteriales bacterium]